MGYWTYYLGWILLMYALRTPWLLLGIVLFLLLRRFIPDPGVLLRTWGRIRTLSAQIEANPANAAARRDLARIYLQRKRPGRAIALLDEALAKHPNDAELLYLKGVAHHRKGDHESALDPLVRAVELDPRVAFGEPYLVAGDALAALGRLDAAEDAYVRFVDSNGSSVEGQLKLARVLYRARRHEEAVRAVDEALDTYGKLPRYARRKQLGWWLRCQVAKATIQHRPGAIGFGIVLTSLGLAVGWSAANSVRRDLADRHGVLPGTFGIRALVTPAPAPSRFVRLDPASVTVPLPGGGIAMREATGGKGFVPPGQFLCRIWARYGPADPGALRGPAYVFRDTATGVVLAASTLQGLPTYSLSETTEAARTTAESFDALLEETRPVDCSVTVEVDSATMSFGMRRGRPFAETLAQ